MKKIFFLAVLIIFANIFASNVHAEIKTYTATDESYANEIEKQEMAKKRAVQKAIQSAREKAGVYLKSYVRTENLQLTDEEILAATSINYKIVGEPTFTRDIQQISDKTSVIVWKATVSLNIDDADLKNFAARDAQEKSKIVQQNERLANDFKENDQKFKNLIERSKNITSETERAQIKSEMDKIDNEFAAISKVAEAIELSGDYEGQIKILNEAIKLDPTFDYAYFSRGYVYGKLKNYQQSIKDYTQAINLDSNFDWAYINRGNIYLDLKNYQQAIEDFTQAIKLDPNYADAYNNRGKCYKALGKNDLAEKDFAKARELGYNG